MNRMKLGEILSVKHGWAFKGEYFAEDGEQSILTPGNFFEKGGFKPNNGKERYYTGTYPKEYLCHKGDLIVAMTQQAEGLLGSTALVPENNKYLHNQRIGLITCDEKRLSCLFSNLSIRLLCLICRTAIITVTIKATTAQIILIQSETLII